MSTIDEAPRPIAFYALAEYNGLRYFHELTNPAPPQLDDGLMSLTPDVEIHDWDIPTGTQFREEVKSWVGTITGRFRRYTMRVVPNDWVPLDGTVVSRAGHQRITIAPDDGPALKFATHIAIPIADYTRMFGDLP